MPHERPSRGLEFTSDAYRSAARERLVTAKRLYELRDYVMCHYLAGLAVECLLRAYIYRRSTEFDSRHDLYALYNLSGLADIARTDRAFAAYGALGIVVTR